MEVSEIKEVSRLELELLEKVKDVEKAAKKIRETAFNDTADRKNKIQHMNYRMLLVEKVLIKINRKNEERKNALYSNNRHKS